MKSSLCAGPWRNAHPIVRNGGHSLAGARAGVRQQHGTAAFAVPTGKKRSLLWITPGGAESMS